MLVLSRRIDDAIVVGKDITIKVLGVDKNGQVRLGIDAPRDLRIMRAELLTEVRDENRKAVAEADRLANLDAIQRLVKLSHPKDETT